jgi:hypothetical protein
MNAILPSTEWTGQLELTEVFDFFDGPRFFLCRNAEDQHFLGYWTGANATGDFYWIVPISTAREESIRSGSFTLFDALSKPEEGFLYECRQPFAKNPAESRRITPEALNPDLLPDPEDRIGGDSQSDWIPAVIDSSLGDAA